MTAVALATRAARPVYSEVMEDYSVVADALRPKSEDVVVVVASAGDNVFNALLDPSRRVFGVDLDPVQIDFCRIKEFALRALTWGEFAELVGSLEGSPARRSAALDRMPRALVERACGDAAARAAIERTGLAGCGELSAFVAPLRDALASIVGREALEQLLVSPDGAERRRLWRERFDTPAVLELFAGALNRQTISNAFIPDWAFERMAEPEFHRHYHRVLEHLTVDHDPTSNHFLHRLWLGRFRSPDDVPLYLRREAHAQLRARLDLVSWHRADLLDFLATLPDASVDAYNLSNILDWSADDHHDALWEEVDRTAADGARVFLRSFLARRDPPASIERRWSSDVARSRAMALADRVGYFSRYELWTRSSAR